MAKFVPITAAAFRRTAKKRGPSATSVAFNRKLHRIVIELDNGVEVSFDPKNAYGLRDSHPEDLAGVEIVGAGGSIHFPKLDEFFTVANLMEGFFGPMDWARGERRAEASRQNGKKGGRPRKVSQKAASSAPKARAEKVLEDALAS